MMDPHRKAHIEAEFVAWGNGKPQLPTDNRDWTADDARALGQHIREFDVMMHRLGLCPPKGKGGVRKGARDLCCHICEAAVAARSKPR